MTDDTQAKSFADMTGDAPIPPPSDADFDDAAPITLGSRDFQAGKPKMVSGSVAVPRLRLAQGLTAEVTRQEAKSGQWVLGGYEAKDEVIFVPLLYNEGREKRALQQDDPNRSVLCKSADAVQGVGDPGVLCATCLFAAWTPDPKNPGKNKPPLCKLQITYIGYSVTHETIVSLTFQSTGETAASQVNLFAQSRGLGNFAIKLTSQSRTAGRNTFQVPVPTYFALPRDQLKEASMLLLGSPA